MPSPNDPCPPHTTWDRALKAALFDRYLLVMSQTGTDAQRRQQSWERIADVVGRDLGLVHDYVTPPALTLQRLTVHFTRST